MFKFAFHMMIADVKRRLKKFSILALPLLFLLIGIAFTDTSTAFYWVYFSMILIDVYRPMMSKIYHVLPLSIKQIKALLHLRILLFTILLFAVEGSAVLLFQAISMPWEKGGFLYGNFLICSYILLSATSVVGFLKKKSGVQWGQLILGGLTIFALFLGVGLFEEIWGFRVICTLSLLVLIISELYLVFYTRKMDFYDYCYVPAAGSNQSEQIVERA